MWRSKKFIIITVLAAAMLAASIGRTVVAADNGDDNGVETLLERVREEDQKTTYLCGASSFIAR